MTKAIILAAAAIGVYLGYKLYGDRIANGLSGQQGGNGGPRGGLIQEGGRGARRLQGGANGNGV